MPNLRGVGDPLKTDPHKRMLKRSKRLAKGFNKKKGKSFKEKTKDLKGYEAAGALFSADAWRND